MNTSIATVALAATAALAACRDGEGASPAPDGGGGESPSLIGRWEVGVPGGGSLGVAFAGAEAGGTAETVRSLPVDGEAPTCRREAIGRGTFIVVDGAIDIDTPVAVERTLGCAADVPETLVDPTLAQGFADELGGPIRWVDDMLWLGLYPPMTRVE